MRKATTLGTLGTLGTAALIYGVAMLFTHGTWEVYTHPDKLLSIRFPHWPKESDSETPTPNGPMRTTTAEYSDYGHMYYATAGRFPTTEPLDLQSALTNGRDRALANVGATATSEKTIEIDGIEGIEVEYEGPSPTGLRAHGRMRLLISAKPPVVYLVNVVRLGDVADPNAQKFLDSMHLGTKVESN